MHKNLEVLIDKKSLTLDELKEYYSQLNQNDYTDLIYATFLHQKQNWEMFNDGWNGFLSSEYKKFHFDWFQIKVQFNPTRLVSSSAKVDDESIKKRKCFLCLENLPEEQKGILFESKSQPHERLIFLCNPAPIFNEHFTISDVKHTSQQIFSNISMMLELTELCNNEYTVFYNGPRCGASAPDHFHFQACPAEDLITERDFLNHPEKFQILTEKENVLIRFISKEIYLRNVLTFSSKDKFRLTNYFQKFYKALQEVNGTTTEPLMNIFALMRSDDYHIVIFPREKHRPDCYFAEGDANMLISPGLVDMCGMLITPLQKDFERINEEIIRQVYSEVSLSTSKFQSLLEKLNQS
jgi:ATP adenylyltransferase/5',5'''-P-1,P-4-tetraphosphate phosphorylase II